MAYGNERVAQVFITQPGKERTAIGSGFLIASNLVLTSKHIFDKMRGDMEVVMPNARPRPLRRTVVDLIKHDTRDLALLPLTVAEPDYGWLQP
ncbi:MAG: hypothetical protein ACRD0P_14590, partial [Stackebrandtia sp.]